MLKQIENMQPGDLITFDWCDASVGKSSGSGMGIDVPVKSWGLAPNLFAIDRRLNLFLRSNQDNCQRFGSDGIHYLYNLLDAYNIPPASSQGYQ